MELECADYDNLGLCECPSGLYLVGSQGLCVPRKEPKAHVCLLPVDPGTDSALACFLFVCLFV